MEEKIRTLVISWITQHNPSKIPPGGLKLDFDLLRGGVIDSMDYLNIVEFVGEELGVEIDIGQFEDAQLSTVGGLSRQISKQAP
jgi:acyl carrier protein